jgi:kynurenine formamidase
MRTTRNTAGGVCAATLAALLLYAPGRAADNSARKPTLTVTDFDKIMASISNAGRWGKEDQLGALNLITPEKRRQAAALAHEGVSVSLAHNVIKQKASNSPPFEHRMVGTGLQPGADSSADVYTVQYHGYTQTHLDALCHLFYKGHMYNGISQREVTEKGAGKLSVLFMKDGLFTRGVLMDIPRLLGVEYLPGRRAILPEDLDAWEKTSGVKVGSGDAIFIRTGRWARRAAHGDWEFENDSAGLDVSCLPWLRRRDVSILASDLASDLMPSGIEGVKMPIHLGAIVAMGVPIFDNCDLERLSAETKKRNRWDFLMTAAPLAVEGGTGSPINPIAVF